MVRNVTLAAARKKEGWQSEMGGKETNEVQVKNDKKSREQQGGEKSGAGISNRKIKLACWKSKLWN